MNLIEQIKVNDVSIDGYQGTYYSNNPEYVQVTTDSEGKILEGIKSDGAKHIGGNLIVDGSIYNESFTNTFNHIVEDAQERIDEVLESAEDILLYFDSIDNTEWLSVITDSDGKVLGGRKIDGTIVENMPIKNPTINEISNSVEKMSNTFETKADKCELYNYLHFPNITPRKPCIIFQMDGGTHLFSNVFLFTKLLKDYNVDKCTFLILPNTLENYRSIILKLRDEGYEIALHGEHAGSNFTEYIDSYLSTFANYRMLPNGYVELGTQIPTEYLPEARKYFSWIIENGGDYMSFDTNYLNALQSITDKPYQLKRLGMETIHTDYSAELIQTLVTRIKDAIDNAISNGDVLVLYGHSYNLMSNTSYTVYPEVLIPILEYLKPRLDTMKCVTGNTTEIIEYYYTKRYYE